MKHRLNFYVAIAFGFIALAGLGGCAQVQQAYDTAKTAYSAVTGAKVSREAVVVARNAFNATEVTATNYLRLKRCDGTNGPICRDPAATKEVIKWVREGRDARNALTRFMKEHPGELGPRGVYDALVTATDRTKSALSTYRGG